MKKRTFTAIVAVLAVLFAAQMPAAAHSPTAYHTYDSATISDDHTWGYVCDNERDGNYVYAEYQTLYGKDRVYDGGDSNCTSRKLIGKASAFRVCEQTKGCTKHWTKA